MSERFLKYRKTWAAIKNDPLIGDGDAFNEWLRIIVAIASGAMDHTPKTPCYEQKIREVTRPRACMRNECDD